MRLLPELWAATAWKRLPALRSATMHRFLVAARRLLPELRATSTKKHLLPLPELWAASAQKHLLPKRLEALLRHTNPARMHLLALLLEALRLGLNPTITACAVAAGEGLYRQNLLNAGYWLMMAATVEGLGPWAIRVLDRLLFPVPTP